MTFENKLARFMKNTGPARFFIPIGLILIVFGIVMLGANTDNYVETTGTIISVTEGISDDNGGHQYDVGVKFTVDGKEYETTFPNLGGTFKEGEDIKVFYDPDDPNNNTNSKSGVLAIIFIAAGAAAVLGGIYFTVNAFKKSKELDRIAPTADGRVQIELDGIKSTAGVVEYYFRFDGNSLKPGYIIEDAERNILYEGKMLKNALVGARTYEFKDHRTGYSEQHEIGHVMTSSYNDEFFSVRSSFKFDGAKIWDYLHNRGLRLSTNMHSKFPYLIYDVTKDGSAFARIESCSVYVHEDDEAQHKLKVPAGNMYYRFWTASDDLESLFLTIFAISECEQTVVE